MTEQFILTSNDQQTQLNVRHWPCPSPKAVVQLIHGMAEHIQRYDEFARFKSIRIYRSGHDHLGHGESVQQTHRSMVLENKGLKMSLQIFISETMGCESISTIALFYDGSQHGVFRLAQLSARLSCDCARSHFHGHWNKSVTFNRSIAFY